MKENFGERITEKSYERWKLKEEIKLIEVERRVETHERWNLKEEIKLIEVERRVKTDAN